MMGLTLRQSALLSFLREHSQQHGTMPSFQQMSDHLGLNSKSTVHKLINCLEERGHIRRMPGRAKAIEVVDTSGLARFSSAELQAELDRRARQS